MRRPVHEAPPFPALVWDNGWEGEAFLPAYGTTPVSIAAEDSTRTPTTAQARAFTRLVEENEALDDAVMRAVLDEYPGFRELYHEFDPENADRFAPRVASVDDLERLIDLGTVHVLEVETDGEAYVGFQFSCTWDREHGLGVMTHAGRVVDVGGADVAFTPPADAWKAWSASESVRQPSTAPPSPSRQGPAPAETHTMRRWWEFWKRG